MLFARDCIDRYDATARANGARIVNSCGYDSVPSDLGVWLTARRAAEDEALALLRAQLPQTPMREVPWLPEEVGTPGAVGKLAAYL